MNKTTAQQEGRYSRRHETQESHDEAVAAHPYSGGKDNRIKRAIERDQYTEPGTPSNPPRNPDGQ